MVVKHCCYGLCNSDSRYKDRPHMAGIFFIPFPKPTVDLVKCQRWIQRCGRQNFRVENVKRQTTFICSKHFVGQNGPTEEHPDPIPATATARDLKNLTKTKRKAPKPRQAPVRLELDRPGTNPTNDQENTDILLAAEALIDLQYKPVSSTEQENEPVLVQPSIPSTSMPEEQLDLMEQESEVEHEQQKHTCDKGTLTDPDLSLRFEVSRLKVKLLRAEAESRRKIDRFSIHQCVDSDSKMKFYTGLTYKYFLILWNLLGPAAENLKMWRSTTDQQSTPTKGTKTRLLKPKEQLFLTLVRLRCGFLFTDIAYRFNISTTLATRIFITWIQFLYITFRKIPMLPKRDQFPTPVPAIFKKFKNIRLIIDCTEFKTQSPLNYQKKGNMYSHYKSHATVKVLIGIIPSGAVSFISDAYEGSISDREIYIKSGLGNLLESSDLILADRGFTIQDLLNEIGCHINFPPFLNKRDRFTSEEVQETQIIASSRIHVERSIGRIKQYRLLQKVLPLKLLPVVSQIIYVAGALVNFEEPLVK